MTDEVRLARVTLASLVEPGHSGLGRLVRATGPVAALDRVLAGDGPADLVDAARARLAGRRHLEVAAHAIEVADRLGARLVTPEDADWPVQVEDLVRISRPSGEDRDLDPPLAIWVRGGPSSLDVLDRSVALVGARAATAYGMHLATELGYGLADQGWTVVSGGAYGIDAAAHRGAMAAGGVTVAVLASGLDTVYPLGHASLFERIADEGLIISEWPPGARAHRTRFLVRNRLIAAATRGTVVVEAAARSGARRTARRARQLGRALMACPGPATSAMSVGCHEEMRENHARVVTGTEHVLEEVGRIGEYLSPPARGPVVARDGLEGLAARVLDAVPTRRARTAGEIAAEAGVSPTDARRTLPALVAAALVVAEPDGRYRAARPTAAPVAAVAD